MSTLRVTVPATSANLGPGFDVLGLALDLYNIFTVESAPPGTISIEASGYAEGLPADETNLFYRAFAHLYTLEGHPVPGVRLRMDVHIPPGKGLGSSATAVVGGLVAANTMLGNPYASLALLSEAVKLEQGNHADNVAPALLGGLVVNVFDHERVISVPLPFPEDLKAVLFTPDFEMDTVQGRALMPSSYSKRDTVFSTGRVALFLSAILLRRYDLLQIAMEDRLHQPYRAGIFRLMPAILAAAVGAGAHGACLSGGGSSILAFASDRFEPIGEAMIDAASVDGVEGEVRILDINMTGAAAAWEGNS